VDARVDHETIAVECLAGGYVVLRGSAESPAKAAVLRRSSATTRCPPRRSRHRVGRHRDAEREGRVPYNRDEAEGVTGPVPGFYRFAIT